MGCDMRIRAGLRRFGTGGDGQELADGRFCWKCRRRHAEPTAKPIRVGDRVRVVRGRLDGLVGRIGSLRPGGLCTFLVGPAEFTVRTTEIERLRKER